MTWANTTLVTRGSAALRTLVTWVVLIASRDGFCNPLKPNSQDYTKPYYIALAKSAPTAGASAHNIKVSSFVIIGKTRKTKIITMHHALTTILLFL
jgi:hypothetical protein